MGFLIHFKKKKQLKDDYGNEIVMFFNGDFVEDIAPLISAYTYNKISRVTEDKRKAIVRHGIVQIKETLELMDRNYKLNLEKFIQYGQQRGKDWDYLTLSEYKENEHLIPKPKQKFINPSKRRRYALSK